MEILSPEVAAYLDRNFPSGDPVLEEMEQTGKGRQFPIIGPQVGRLLYQLVLLSGAERVFEMGSGFGYSAYWMAKGLKPGGRVICTDSSAENKASAERFFEKGGLADRLDFRLGDALEILEETAGSFDIVFNDVEKESYPRAAELALPRLRPGGLFICDNMLWSGRVVRGTDDKSTRGIQALTRLLLEDPALVTTLIPLRDGISITVKLPAPAPEEGG